MPDITGDSLQVHIEQLDAATILKPIGDVDLTASPILREELRKAHSPTLSKLIIDLSSVSYMDSSGVATLVEAMQVARQNNTTMILSAMQDKVRSIFEIARLDTVFTIVDTTDEAINS